MHVVPQARALLYKINSTRNCVSAIRRIVDKKKEHAMRFLAGAGHAMQQRNIQQGRIWWMSSF